MSPLPSDEQLAEAALGLHCARLNWSKGGTTRMRTLRTIGNILLAGSIVPAGVAFAQVSQKAPTNGAVVSQNDPAPTTANAQKTFSKIQDLAQNVRQDVGPLKFKTNGTNLTWKLHSIRLMRTKKAVNQMEMDVNQLESRKANLPPWQQELLGNVKEDTHEMVFQTSAAIKTLNQHHNKMALVTTNYPQNIDMISQRANDAASSIGTVFQRHGVDMD
jgi:hypothetical protein